MNTMRALIALSAMACASSSWAASPTLTELGREVPGYWWPSLSGLAVGDFDRDGLDDIVVPGVAGSSVLQVLGHGPGGLVAKQALFVPEQLLRRIITVPIAGVPHLVTVSDQGLVRRYAGWPLVEAQVFDLDRDVGAAAVGDVDNNGAMDLVVASAWWRDLGVSAYALATGELRWTVDGASASDILIGQFDGDPAREIVLASTPGLVIDGATQATDWSYADGFGSYLAAGRFQASGGNQFVAAQDWDILMTFQSAPWSPIWDLKMFDIDAVAAADLDGDGFDEIIQGDGQWGEVNIIDGQTHAIRLSIPHEGHGMSGLEPWDPDGDGKADIAFAPNSASLPDPMFTFADSTTGQTLGLLPAGRAGPYQDLALGRVAGGTRLVYPISEESYLGGAWVELEALTGQVIWRSPAATEWDDLFALEPSDAVYSDDGSGNALLVLAGAGWNPEQNRIIALDAITHSVRWTLEATELGGLSDRELRGAAALDLGAGPVIGACLVTYGDARILLVDAASGNPLWTSVAMASDEGQCSLMVWRLGGGNPLVVAVLDGSLRAYDSVTRLLVWSLETPVDGASFLSQGVSGPEFVVFEGSRLHFHDATTRAVLRSFDLGMPVTAVQQARGDIHGLLVAAGDRMLLVDGTNGAIRHASDYLGSNLAAGNRIATADLGNGYTRVGVGSDGGVIRYRLYTGDGIFDDGFEPAVD